MPNLMNIRDITLDVTEWTCKIQVVDKSRPLENKIKDVRFQNFIFQDEEEEQVRATLYDDDIEYFQGKFVLFHTYLVTCAVMRKLALEDGQRVNKFEWIIDRFTIIDPVNEDLDKLPLPTMLSTVPFLDIPNLTKGDEFDVLGIVMNCRPAKCVGSHGQKCQELIVMDDMLKPILFTLWEEFTENEGMILQEKYLDYPVILARRVGIQAFHTISVRTKFNTTILIDPPYPQCLQLKAWAAQNKQLLISYTLRTTRRAPASTSITVIPVDEDTVSIIDVQSQPSGLTFYVEGEICIINELQLFYILRCSECNQQVRSVIKRTIHCTSCNRETMLTPRCHFDINVSDASGATTATVVDETGERLLSLSAAEIYDITSAHNQLLPISVIERQLAGKIFRLQLKREVVRERGIGLPKLFILSCTEKQIIGRPILLSGLATDREKNKQKVGYTGLQHEQQKRRQAEGELNPKCPAKRP